MRKDEEQRGKKDKERLGKKEGDRTRESLRGSETDFGEMVAE